MSMGRRKNEEQGSLFVPADQLQSPAHAFFDRLNQVLDRHDFDRRVEELCEEFYDDSNGRPSVPPGVYFRMLLVGYFEGIGSERALEWRCQDSLSLRAFLGLQPGARVPDHSTLSRTRQRFPLELFKAFERLVLGILKEEGLLKGRHLAIDSTMVQANSSMKTIVRRDTNKSYPSYVKDLAKAEGKELRSAEDVARYDRRRKGKKLSNTDWKPKHDEDAGIGRMKDGRTRCAYKPEHCVDLETGAILGGSLYPAGPSDSTTLTPTITDLDETLESIGLTTAGSTLVADKGYYSIENLAALQAVDIETCIAEPRIKGRRRWKGKSSDMEPAYRKNRRRNRREAGHRLHRKRSELVERPFEHLFDRGNLRRCGLRGIENLAKRHLAQRSAYNLSLILRREIGAGTPKEAMAKALKAAIGRFDHAARVAKALVASCAAASGLIAPAMHFSSIQWRIARAAS